MQATAIQNVRIGTAGSTWTGGTISPTAMVRTSWVNGFIYEVLEYYPSMRNLLRLSFCGGLLFLMHLSADTYQIEYQVSSIGTDEYQYTYYVSDLTGDFIANQEFDIEFDPTIFASLSNPTTSDSNWDISPADGDLTQPGWCGPTCTGNFLPYYEGATPTTGATFTLDATLNAGQTLPTQQTFLIEDFNSPTDPPPTLLFTGNTQAYDSVPEPANVALSGVCLLVLAVSRFVKRSAGGAA